MINSNDVGILTINAGRLISIKFALYKMYDELY